MNPRNGIRGTTIVLLLMVIVSVFRTKSMFFMHGGSHGYDITHFIFGYVVMVDVGLLDH